MLTWYFSLRQLQLIKSCVFIYSTTPYTHRGLILELSRNFPIETKTIDGQSKRYFFVSESASHISYISRTIKAWHWKRDIREKL